MAIDKMLPARLEAGDASRPADWRWQRAGVIRADERYARVWRNDNDREVLTSIRFRAALDAAQDGLDLVRVRRQWPRLYEAYSLWIDKRRMVSRWELEARLLANESRESISNKLGFEHHDTVGWYERVFYNVLPRLKNPSYIVNVLLGEQAHVGMSERDLEILWKILGYRQGPSILDILCLKDTGVAGPDQYESRDKYFQAEHDINLGIKAAIAARIMPSNSMTQPSILEYFAKTRELAKMADNGSNRSQLETYIMEMMTDMPFQIGGRAYLVAAHDTKSIVGRLPPGVVEMDNSNIELRDSELLELTAGPDPATV